MINRSVIVGFRHATVTQPQEDCHKVLHDLDRVDGVGCPEYSDSESGIFMKI